jgi:hypothetical protein
MVLIGSVALVGAVVSTLAVFGQHDPLSDIKFYGEGVTPAKTQAFLTFLAQHGKTYATKDDVNTRFEIFSKNYDHIEEHNENNEHFKKAINKFADLTEEEFTHHYLRGLKTSAKKE